MQLLWKGTGKNFCKQSEKILIKRRGILGGGEVVLLKAFT